MANPPYLGELEQAVLWTVLRLAGEGYGATILEEVDERLQRRVTAGAVYATLDRLEEKGMIVSRLADPDEGRGGRRKRYMAVTEVGREALARVRREWITLWDGLEEAVGAHEP
jgi:PadR family transcriptional regulator, regulatory protein PadR